MCIAIGKIWADDDYRQPACQNAKARLEHVRGDVHPTRRGTPRAYVAREVLSQPQHHAATTHEREQGEADRVYIGPEQPDGVDIVEQAPKATGRVPERAEDFEWIREASVVGQPNKLDIRAKGIVRTAGLGIQTAGDDETVDQRAQTGHETHECSFSRHTIRVLLEGVVDVDCQTHHQTLSRARSADWALRSARHRASARRQYPRGIAEQPRGYPIVRSPAGSQCRGLRAWSS